MTGPETEALTRMSPRALNRATLARQLLLRREEIGILEGLRRVVALQAQHPASPYVALWNRLHNFVPGELDAELSAYRVVRSNLMRVTLHAVSAEDFPAFREAMEPSLRDARLGHRRFMESRLTAEDAAALIPEIVEFADEPRTNGEFEAWLERRLGDRRSGAWWGLRHYAPLLRAPNGETWSFGHSAAYLASRLVTVPVSQETSSESLKTLVLRYLEGFGPASVADIAQFAMVQRGRVKKALQALSGELEQFEGSDRPVLFDVAGGPRPGEETPAPPRLLPMWDSILLAYHDRSRVIPPEYRKIVIRVNGDVLPTLLVDGYVAGVWRPVSGGIEAKAFHPLSRAAWQGLDTEARSLHALLASRETEIYRRFHHWWSKLPEGEERLLGADQGGADPLP